MKYLWARKILSSVALGIIIVIIFALSLRGLPGNPRAEDLSLLQWQGNGPFESSNDRGRFALTFSFLENHSLSFSVPLAQFAAPDLAKTKDGKYVSLFAPGVSFLVMPGYIIGRYLGASQVGTFAVVTIFAIMNMLLIYVIARRLGAYTMPAILGALAFIFATPAFTYAVSLSQHHFSVFLLLLSIYLVIRWNNWWSLSIIWFACALSIVVDNPNVFLMFPVGLYALGKIIITKADGENVRFVVKPLYVFTFLAMAFPLVFFGWFNQVSNGNSFQLAGTLQRVISVPSGGAPDNTADKVDNPEESLVDVPIDNEGKIDDDSKDSNAVNFFQTRNIFNGLYVHFISGDRGILRYAPIVLLGILGFIILLRRYSGIAATMIASVGVNILLYSMWGDPWGGWAFGSRYLIPTYALLSIGLGVILTHWRKNMYFLILFFIIFVYSARINALGSLGTSAIPPQAEVLALEKLTGKVQKFDYRRSQDYLFENGSKSIAYQTFFKKHMTAYQYYNLVSGLIIILGGVIVGDFWLLNRRKKE